MIDGWLIEGGAKKRKQEGAAVASKQSHPHVDPRFDSTRFHSIQRVAIALRSPAESRRDRYHTTPPSSCVLSRRRPPNDDGRVRCLALLAPRRKGGAWHLSTGLGLSDPHDASNQSKRGGFRFLPFCFWLWDRSGRWCAFWPMRCAKSKNFKKPVGGDTPSRATARRSLISCKA